MPTVTAPISRRCRPFVASAVVVSALVFAFASQTQAAVLSPSRVSGRSNLTAYLVDHAGKLPRAAAISSAERMQPRWRDSRQHLAPVDRQALAEMRRVWSVARAYFPGQGMPVPRFGA